VFDNSVALRMLDYRLLHAFFAVLVAAAPFSHFHIVFCPFDRFLCAQWPATVVHSSLVCSVLCFWPPCLCLSAGLAPTPPSAAGGPRVLPSALDIRVRFFCHSNVFFIDALCLFSLLYFYLCHPPIMFQFPVFFLPVNWGEPCGGCVYLLCVPLYMCVIVYKVYVHMYVVCTVTTST